MRVIQFPQGIALAAVALLGALLAVGVAILAILVNAPPYVLVRGG